MSFCGNCGAKMADDARVCGQCGTPVQSKAPVNNGFNVAPGNMGSSPAGIDPPPFGGFNPGQRSFNPMQGNKPAFNMPGLGGGMSAFGNTSIFVWINIVCYFIASIVVFCPFYTLDFYLANGSFGFFSSLTKYLGEDKIVFTIVGIMVVILTIVPLLKKLLFLFTGKEVKLNIITGILGSLSRLIGPIGIYLIYLSEVGNVIGLSFGAILFVILNILTAVTAFLDTASRKS